MAVLLVLAQLLAQIVRLSPDGINLQLLELRPLTGSETVFQACGCSVKGLQMRLGGQYWSSLVIMAFSDLRRTEV